MYDARFNEWYFLQDLIILVINDGISKDSGTKTVFNEELTDRFISLNFDIDTINDNLSSIDGAVDDARHSKKSCVIVINTTYGLDTSREDTKKRLWFKCPFYGFRRG